MSLMGLKASSIFHAEFPNEPNSGGAAGVLFLINIIVLIAVIGSTVVLRAIVRSRRRIKPSAVADASTPPHSTVLPRVLMIVAYGAKIWAGLEALVYLGRFVYALFAGAEAPKGIVTYLFTGSLIWLGSICEREAKRMRTPLAEDVLALDRRPPVLFLRSFAQEEETLPKTSAWIDLSSVPALLEEVVLSQFQKIGPVIGLANPLLRGRPADYSPYDTESKNWQERAGDLIRGAAVIVVVVAKTVGLAWETRQIQSNGRLPQTLFVFRPRPSESSRDALAWLLGELGMPLETRFRVHGKGEPLIAHITETEADAYLENGYEDFRYASAVKQALQDLGANRFGHAGTA